MDKEANFFNNKKLTLCKRDGSTVLSGDAFTDKEYVLVYVADSRSAESAAFLPQLKSFYDAHAESESFEVVFMTRDREEGVMWDAFTRTHGDWLCLRHADARSMLPVWGPAYGLPQRRPASTPVVMVFSVSGGACGGRALMTASGREWIEQFPDAAGFPWAGKEVPPLTLVQKYVTPQNIIRVLALIGAVVAFLINSRKQAQLRERKERGELSSTLAYGVGILSLVSLLLFVMTIFLA